MAVELIRLSGEPAASIRRAQSIYEYFSAQGLAATRSKPDLSPAAVAAFERAGRG